MSFPNRATIECLREMYTKGTRVELVKMDDPYTKLRPGDKGTVNYVDDVGGIHINWDSGSTLAAVWGEDKIKLITED